MKEVRVEVRNVDQKVYGIADIDEFSATINPNQSEQELLGTAIHEGLHLAFPKLTEKQVQRAELIITQIPWKLGFRLNKKKFKKRKRK